jgi:drug/metabolite transporter (DMT)-like permease
MGSLLVLGSGAAFGAMGIFGKLAYEQGATMGTLLSVRFALAAALLWALEAARRERGSRPGAGAGGAARRRGAARLRGVARLRALPRRDVAAALALGAVCYALQAGLFFAALERIDAALAALLIYTSPAIVAVAAVVLGRERLTARAVAALVLASAGVVLVIGKAGAIDPLGAALAMGAAIVYSAYILISDGVARRLAPRVVAALVCTGAAFTLSVGTAVAGDFRPEALTPAGWAWIACLAAVSTVAAIGLFFAGLRRVGPTNASILSTVEPLATVILAFLIFGETLGVLQLAGGTLVLAAALERMTA